MVLLVLLSIILTSFSRVLASDGEEPATPICRYIPKNSLSFCSMVDYFAVVDESDIDGAVFDAKAKFYYENLNVMLQRFRCSAKYSLYTCDDCRDAYKYWICSIKFQKCGQETINSAAGDQVQYHSDICPYNSVSSSATITSESSSSTSSASTCVEGSSGRHRTCLSICEDVVRKCPYVLNFQCPTTETMFFSADITTCNKMDRTKNPDRVDQLWPGTFATT